MNEFEVNQQVAEQIRNAGRRNGKEFARGDYVALLDGNVVAVAGNLDAALHALRAIDPDPGRGMLVEVTPHVVDVIR